jgi:hypothetical protein
MELSIVDVWDYKIDETKGIILNNNILEVELYSIKRFNSLLKYEKIIYLRNLIDKTQTFGSILNIKLFLKLMYYIYYLLYFTKFYNDNFYNILISKLEMFIKDDYFKKRKISYKDMKTLKNIYYVFEKNYICEYKDCLKSCCNKQNLYCNVHLRNINKKSKIIRDVTKLPIDISKIIYEYSL